MSFFQAKTILAVFLTAAGLAATLSMLTLMGRKERRLGVTALRNTHRVAGYAFAALLAVLAIMGLRHLGTAGDTLALRGVLHWTLASLLLFLLLLKLTIARFFKQFLKFVPAMGMAVITLTLVVVTLSAVFYTVTGGFADAPAELEQADGTERSEEAQRPAAAAGDRDGGGRTAPAGDAAAGANSFATYCAGCHHSDSNERKVGPGLLGLFEMESTSVGDQVTRETVRLQLLEPSGTMPSFRGFLTDEEIEDVVAYLETL